MIKFQIETFNQRMKTEHFETRYQYKIFNI